jgi:hypothetical protein
MAIDEIALISGVLMRDIHIHASIALQNVANKPKKSIGAVNFLVSTGMQFDSYYYRLG